MYPIRVLFTMHLTRRRETMGLFHLLRVYKVDGLAACTPLVLTVVFLFSLFLLATGYLVPGCLANTGILYLVSYYLCDQSVSGSNGFHS